ncbi:hypothetical protein [Roseovarius sp. A46]|uniref:hypothetical protein n=1 Tax=Roseovarius sp. A46 TaxID=2109331 RepID=UPI0010131031|nr:hypothetical protein [Roseovarius sp. A46]
MRYMPIRVGAWNGMKSAAVMTYRMESGTAPADHFAAGLEEYEGRTPEDAATTEIAVRNAMHTIEKLMREDRKRRVRAGLPELVLPDEIAAEQQAHGHGRRGTGGARGALARLWSWRPGAVHAAWGTAFVVVLAWPKGVLVALFAAFVIGLACVALFGPEILERTRKRAARLFARRDDGRGARGDTDEEEMPEARPDPFDRLHDLRG